MLASLLNRHSLKARVTLMTLLLFLLTLWGLAWYASHELRDGIRTQVARQQSSALALLTTTTEEKLAERVQALETAAGEINSALLHQPKVLQAHLQNHFNWSGLFSAGLLIVDRQGRQLSSSSYQRTQLVPHDSDQPFIQMALAQEQTVIGQVTLNQTSKTPQFGMATPLKNQLGQTVAVLAGLVDLTRPNFLDVITQGKYGTTGGYLVIDAVQRRIIFASDPRRRLEQLSEPGIHPGTDQLLEGYSGARVLRNPFGQEVLVQGQALSIVPWVVAVTLPTDEAYGPIKAMQQRLLVTTALATLIAALLVWWLMRATLVPVFDTMKRLTDMSASTEPAQPLPVVRQDELGLLVTAFNTLLQRQLSNQAALQHHAEMLARTEAVANIGSWHWQVAPDRVHWSEQLFRIYQRDPAQGVPTLDQQASYYPPADLQRLRQAIALALAKHRPYEIALDLQRADGSLRHCIARGRVTLGPDQTVAEVYGTLQDITELKQAQAAVAANETRLQEIFNTALDAVVGMDEQGRITHWNQAAETMFGWQHKEAVGQKLGDLIVPPRYRQAHLVGLQNFSHNAQSQVLHQRIETTALRRTGVEFAVELSILPFYTEGKHHFTAFMADISERRTAQFQLQLAGNVFNHAFEGITITDAEANILDINESFTRITGYSRAEVLGQNPRLLHSGRQDAAFYQAFWAALLDSGHWCGEIWNRRKSGEIYPEWLDISAIKDSQGVTQQYVALFSDITARKELEDRIRQMAFFDPLTSLPNRRLLSDRLGQALLAGKRSHSYGALMFLDLDNFKPLNDLHGHALGDLLLTEAAHRLQTCVRQNDTVARIGGDEFVVMLAELDADQDLATAQALAIAEKIRVSLSERYQLMPAPADQAPQVIEHHCSCSIGVALFEPGQSDQEAIIKQADAAMYRAKASGRNQVQLVAPTHPDSGTLKAV